MDYNVERMETGVRIAGKTAAGVPKTVLVGDDGSIQIIDITPDTIKTVGIDQATPHANEFVVKSFLTDPNINDKRGLAINRPAFNSAGVIPGVTTYWAVDTGFVYCSDGTKWMTLVEVGAWTV